MMRTASEPDLSKMNESNIRKPFANMLSRHISLDAVNNEVSICRLVVCFTYYQSAATPQWLKHMTAADGLRSIPDSEPLGFLEDFIKIYLTPIYPVMKMC